MRRRFCGCDVLCGGRSADTRRAVICCSLLSVLKLSFRTFDSMESAIAKNAPSSVNEHSWIDIYAPTPRHSRYHSRLVPYARLYDSGKSPRPEHARMRTAHLSSNHHEATSGPRRSKAHPTQNETHYLILNKHTTTYIYIYIYAHSARVKSASILSHRSFRSTANRRCADCTARTTLPNSSSVRAHSSSSNSTVRTS